MEATGEVSKTELSRREFVRLALMSSALMMGTGQLLEGEETTPGIASHAAFRSLAPGAVRPEGWLRSYLEKQAAQLGSQLPEISWPFTRAYWAEEQEGESWWPWEQNAYWVDGATRLALVLEDEKLLAKVGRRIQYTLSHADDDGYLGPEFFKEPTGDFHRWPQMLFFRGMGALSDGQGKLEGVSSGQIVEAIRKHYLGDHASYGTPQRNVTNIEDMLWVYERTGDTRMLTMAENAWKEFLKVAADTTHDHGDGDFSELRVYANTPIVAHGVTYAEIVKQPAILYMYTGKEEYLRFALAGQRRIFSHHMLIDGIPSTSEWFRTVTSLDSHETCDIADHTWTWGAMLQATGDGVWADRIERACFNAAPGAIKNDWKSLQYFSCPNQFLATLDSDHNVMEHGGRMMAYQPNPGQRTACCGGNVHRIFPNYAIRMWMKSKDNGLAAVLYGASKVSATVGADNQKIEIAQTTSYPFEEEIHFKINSDRAVSFPLSLRIPKWCATPKLAMNGTAMAMPRVEKGFLVLQRNFKPGDVVTLTLPMKLKVTEWPEDGMGIERGPLVYALPIKANWTSKVERKYTTPEFPSLEAMPASAWNYGIALDKEKVESQVEVKKRTVTAEQALDPWTNPPIALSAPARKIEGWELEKNPEKEGQQFTPCLPDLSLSKVSETVEKITLEPYGSTQLRVTIFPVVKS